MTSAAVVSASGSPGATTTAVLLAMALGERVTVVEASMTGGTAAARLGLGWHPGLLEVAAATRTEITPALLAYYTQLPACGVPVVVGPRNAAEAGPAISQLAVPLTVFAGRMSETLVVDCGAVGAGSPLWPLVAAVDVALLVVRQVAGFPRETAARVSHARGLAVGLAEAGANVAAVVVGDRPYKASEVAAALGAPMAGALPVDLASVTRLLEGGLAERDRGDLARGARGLAERTRCLANAAAGPEEGSLSSAVRLEGLHR